MLCSVGGPGRQAFFLKGNRVVALRERENGKTLGGVDGREAVVRMGCFV